jgi:hypothetical protein
VTGNKVGGELTGSESEIIYCKQIDLDKNKKFDFEIPKSLSVNLFNGNIGIAAVGGYFWADENFQIVFSIQFEGKSYSVTYDLEKNRPYSLGYDLEIDLEIDFDSVEISIEFIINKPTAIGYTHFACGFVAKDEFVGSEEAYRHYSNSKKHICFPEQFYFETQIELEGSKNGVPIITKSCNRCQRFLPVNSFNQRLQLAYSNHCTTKAPCTHNGFSKYKIVKCEVGKDEVEEYFKLHFDKGYTLNNNLITCYYGHQLECKACKKFFVNAALNYLRSSSQHREDSLRRRAVELLCRKLLDMKWIYHQYRISTGREFDKDIWLKFNKQCFNCGEPIKNAKAMHLDHTMPLSHLYPLDESATCLCNTCNNAKSDIFPVDFYSEAKLLDLSKITGIPLDVLKSRSPNEKVVKELKKHVIWFVDDFLIHPEYIKDRDGKKASDSILHSVNKAVAKSEWPFDIVEEYNNLQKANTSQDIDEN